MNNTAYQLKADLESKPSTGFNDNSIENIIENKKYRIENILDETYADVNSGSTICYIK